MQHLSSIRKQTFEYRNTYVKQCKMSTFTEYCYDSMHRLVSGLNSPTLSALLAPSRSKKCIGNYQK